MSLRHNRVLKEGKYYLLVLLGIINCWLETKLLQDACESYLIDYWGLRLECSQRVALLNGLGIIVFRHQIQIKVAVGESDWLFEVLYDLNIEFHVKGHDSSLLSHQPVHLLPLEHQSQPCEGIYPLNLRNRAMDLPFIYIVTTEIAIVLSVGQEVLLELFRLFYYLVEGLDEVLRVERLQQEEWTSDVGLERHSRLRSRFLSTGSVSFFEGSPLLKWLGCRHWDVYRWLECRVLLIVSEGVLDVWIDNGDHAVLLLLFVNFYLETLHLEQPSDYG